MVQISARAHAQAAPAVVYALLRDGASWPEWSPLGAFELLREGETEREGVGALRLFRTASIKSREEIVELVPDRRLSYELRGGLPLRDYRADVDLTPRDGGTDIHWHSRFEPKIPGTGWFYRWFLGRVLRQMARTLAARADATAP
ncbi:SRPBCC family protein [Amycolatopsis sp. NPDC059657]|uniref:SRPBCC family protein n=1 Tax=Amycolatopsis sp. NPDC059657 TaxID=3346899 RepID=UPI00367215A9